MVTPAGVANVIMKDNCMWTWQEGTNQGMTTCFEPTQGDDSIWDNPDISSPDIEYTCFPAVVNDDMFSPPDSVSFTDLDSLMNGQTIPQM